MTDELSALTARIDELERRWRWTASLALLLGAAVLVAACAATGGKPVDILRARGIVITDSAGNARVVLGAPMGDVTEDARLADTVGLVVLDATGKLNVALGAGTPLVYGDGSVEKRYQDETGFTIYDPRNGGERGGMGVNADGSAVVCLDYDHPKEAVCMSVAAGDEYAAVMLNGTPNEQVYDRVGLFLGQDGSGQIKAFGAQGDGLKLEAGTGPPRLVKYQQGERVGEATWTTLSASAD
jgi:hypothetical protein